MTARLTFVAGHAVDVHAHAVDGVGEGGAVLGVDVVDEAAAHPHVGRVAEQLHHAVGGAHHGALPQADQHLQTLTDAAESAGPPTQPPGQDFLKSPALKDIQ